MIEWALASSVLIIAVMMLRRLLMGRISLRLQYLLWAPVLVRLLLPFSIGHSSMSIMNAVPDDIPQRIVSAAASAGVPEGAFSAPVGERPQITYAVPDAEGQAGGAEPFAVGQAGGAAEEYSAQTDWGRIAMAVWLAGAAAVGLFFIFVNMSFAAKVKKGRIPLEVEHCPLPVYISEGTRTPCLFGAVRPSIYITPEAARDPAVLRRVTEHEKTHCRHADHIWSLLRVLCLSLHWYNPLVWRAAALSRLDAELACDEAAIRAIGEEERAEYGRTLIGLACVDGGGLQLAATTMTYGKNEIKERIRLIAKKPKTAVYALVIAIITAVIAVGCTMTGANGNPPLDGTDGSAAYDELSDEWFAAEAWPAAERYAEINGLEIKRDDFTVLLHADKSSADVYFPESDRARSVLVPFALGQDGRWTAFSPQYIERDRGSTGSESDEGADGLTERARALREVFGAQGQAYLTLYTAGGGPYMQFSLSNEYYKKRFEYILDSYGWAPIEAPPTGPDEYWLTLISADGEKTMTFYPGGDGIAAFDDGGDVLYWQAEARESEMNVAAEVRMEYDGLEADCTRIAFYLGDEGAEKAADAFVHSAFGSFLMNLAPGNMCAVEEYDVVEWDVREVSADGDAVAGWFSYAFVPSDFNSPGIWAGNTGMGSGEFEGMLTAYREFALQRQEDGYWHCVEMGTGGVMLP